MESSSLAGWDISTEQFINPSWAGGVLELISRGLHVPTIQYSDDITSAKGEKYILNNQPHSLTKNGVSRRSQYLSAGTRKPASRLAHDCSRIPPSCHLSARGAAGDNAKIPPRSSRFARNHLPSCRHGSRGRQVPSIPDQSAGLLIPWFANDQWFICGGTKIG